MWSRVHRHLSQDLAAAARDRGCLRDKLKLLPPENPAANAVANGEAEIGMTQISEILPYTGAEWSARSPKRFSSPRRLRPPSGRTRGNRKPPMH